MKKLVLALTAVGLLAGATPSVAKVTCRDTAEWGAAYSMVMTEACEHVAGVHDRMPAILPREDWADWLDGPPDAAGLLCRPYELGMRVERTGESWVRR
jgi:putative SOS response-associated peptidase YedK